MAHESRGKHREAADCHRKRVQDWRVIYRVLDDRVVLLIIKIGVRGQVYE